MSNFEDHAKSIFQEAVEKHAPDDWPKFLDKACGDDDKLRQRVEELLQAHADIDSLFDAADPTIDYRPAEQTGQMIGPYKLREQLGIGGMGVVWAAERKKPVRLKVALKVIKPGMDSQQVIARFEAEREALAMMDHPNIAKVLDAGTTDQGRPYFVMELIHGVPITEYCDAHGLTVRERLGLFIQVCKAVQHAHSKLIVHRDIKPSNVLITEHDGTPVPKVIDFGVAKALHRPLTDGSIYTGVFQAIGTLAYMSPEQATLSGKGVDTRADVYGLGVLLYELLTGMTPFDRQQLKQAAFNEALRIIREEDAPNPSKRISTLGDNVTVTYGQRKGAEELGRIVSGDLDCIVMKALEKDRGQRYGTAAEAMRWILIERARQKNRPKHGGDRQRLDLEIHCPASEETPDRLLAIDEALAKLEREQPEIAQLLKLRYFAGMPLKDAAPLLGLSLATAKRRWAFARAFLFGELAD